MQRLYEYGGEKPNGGNIAENRFIVCCRAFVQIRGDEIGA